MYTAEMVVTNFHALCPLTPGLSNCSMLRAAPFFLLYRLNAATNAASLVGQKLQLLWAKPMKAPHQQRGNRVLEKRVSKWRTVWWVYWLLLPQERNKRRSRDPQLWLPKCTAVVERLRQPFADQNALSTSLYSTRLPLQVGIGVPRTIEDARDPYASLFGCYTDSSLTGKQPSLIFTRILRHNIGISLPLAMELLANSNGGELSEILSKEAGGSLATLDRLLRSGRDCWVDMREESECH